MRKLTGLVGLVLLLAGFAGILLARGSMPAQAGLAPGAVPVASPVCGPGTWTGRAPMPVSGAFMATAAQGGRLYTFGGSGNGFSYNPTSNTWTAIAPLPATRSYASAVSDGTYLYVLNGSDGSGPQNSLFRYDPATDSYTTLAAPPIATDEQAAVYLNGKIYRIAGSVNATQTVSVDVYTVSTDTWAPPGSVADYPTALGGLNAVASDGYIYAAGGADQVQSVVSNKTYRYDPATNTWDDAAVPDLPTGRYEGAGDVLDGYWILAGGYAWDYQVSTNVITLDLGNLSAGWTGRAWQPLWRWALGGATVGSAFYTVGGLDWSIQSQADTEQYTFTFCAPTPTGTAPTATRTGTRPPTGTPPSCGTGIWSQQTPYPVPVGGGASAAQGGLLYNFGGAGNGVPDTDAYVYNPGSATWTAIRPLTTALEGSAAVSDGTYLYIAGGINFGGQTSAAFYRYDPASDTYTTLAPAPIDAYDQGLGYLNGKIYRIAGSRGVLGQGTRQPPGAALGKRPDWTVLNEVDAYTISTGTWSTVAPYPQHVEGLVAVGAGGYVYAGGGTVAGGKTYRYDPASNTWDDAAVTDLPEDHYVPASAILNGRWVVAGNGSNPLTSNVVVALDLTNPSGPWTPLPPLPLARAYADGGAIGSSFFAVGGFSDVNNPSATQNTQQYQEHYCPPPVTPSVTPTPMPPTATSTATPPGSPSPTATPTCEPAWSTVANPGSSYLTAVSAHAANDVWAVGRTEIQHWDGHIWSIVPSPSVPSGHGLFGVAAVGTNDVWAVGDTYLNGHYQTLIEHWDGTAWTIVPGPNLSTDNSSLWGGVSATGPDNVWAVGGYGDTTLIEHWDGSQWQVVFSPNASTCANSFNSVIALAPDNVWAAGMYTPDDNCYGVYHALVEHWDGSQWSTVTIPDIGPLTGVAGSAANDVWVTGLSQALHWDGSGWHAMPLPAGTDGRGTTMVDFGVNNAWLLGSTSQNSPVVEHWDGSQWSIAATFNDVDTLYGITAVGPQDLWAVGTGSVIKHYFASCSTPAPTATPVRPSPTGTATTTPVPPNLTGTATGVPASPSPSGTACAVTFTDVHPTDYFYQPVQYLACRGVISGYADHTFRPYSNTTRAQMVKIVVLGFGRPLVTPTDGAYTFADVPPGAPFFDVIETAAAANIVGGYACGGPGEPCDGQHRRYFRPNTNVTRGQLSKIDVLTAGWALQNPATPTFSDVPPGSAFYEFVETAVAHGIISGYADHTFRPNTPATRGQIAKIVYLSLGSP